MTNKRFQVIIKELFIRCRILNISLAFIAQSYFSVPKDVRLNLTHYLVMKINSRIELKKMLQLIILQTLTITILRKFTEHAQKTHPANIGARDVSRTSPFNVPRTFLKAPIGPSRGCPYLTSQGRPDLTSWGRFEMTSRGAS